MREPGLAGADRPPRSDAAGDRALFPSAHRRMTLMRIALDAMGGDHAPGPIVAGAVEAVRDRSDLTVLLVGDQERIEAELASIPDADRARLPIVHASQVVGMEEKP